MELLRLLWSLPLAVIACDSETDATVAPVAGATRSQAVLEYDLDVRIDPARHELAVSGRLQTQRPRTSFWLNPALVLDEVADAEGAIEFRREGARVETTRAWRDARFRYHGRLEREGERDFKSHAWILPSEVRLTEVTLWYPVIYDGPSDIPWPPEPSTGRMTVSPSDALTWVSSGVAAGDGRFEFREPSDLVLVGVPFARVVYEGEPILEIVSPRHAVLAPMLRATWDAHARRLGSADARRVHVVEFPASGTTNGLAFLSSDLIVLSSATCDAVAEDTPRAHRIIAHEMAHRWFGGHLRPEGPATRWLVEAFAEYYAWQFVGERFGADELRRTVAAVEVDAGEVPVDLLSLGWDDERVYTAGALGVRALANAVGPATLDAAVRRLHDGHRAWSVASLFDALQQVGADAVAVAEFRRQWGVDGTAVARPRGTAG